MPDVVINQRSQTLQDLYAEIKADPAALDDGMLDALVMLIGDAVMSNDAETLQVVTRESRLVMRIDKDQINYGYLVTLHVLAQHGLSRHLPDLTGCDADTLKYIWEQRGRATDSMLTANSTDECNMLMNSLGLRHLGMVVGRRIGEQRSTEITHLGLAALNRYLSEQAKLPMYPVYPGS
jgi:hypothetical protein